jgi:hypothetical protein
MIAGFRLRLRQLNDIFIFAQTWTRRTHFDAFLDPIKGYWLFMNPPFSLSAACVWLCIEQYFDNKNCFLLITSDSAKSKPLRALTRVLGQQSKIGNVQFGGFRGDLSKAIVVSILCQPNQYFSRRLTSEENLDLGDTASEEDDSEADTTPVRTEVREMITKRLKKDGFDEVRIRKRIHNTGHSFKTHAHDIKFVTNAGDHVIFRPLLQDLYDVLDQPFK